MLTMTSLLGRTLRACGPDRAIVGPEGALSWAEFGERIARAAAVLMSLGVGPGQRYATVCRNGLAHAELLHAGYWLGAVPTPVNFRLAPPEIAYILDDAECRLAAVDHEFAGLFEAPELVGRAGEVLAVGGPPGARRPRYEDLRDAAAPAPPHDAREEDEALLVYTGGTTGRAKGVLLSHRNIVANALQIGLEVRPRREDVYLHVAPMFHSADLLANPFVMAGAAQLYLPRFSGAAVLGAIETYGVTATLLTPTMLVILLQDPDLGRYDLSSLRQIVYGSAPMAVEWTRKALERFPGVAFLQAYGLTETGPLLTMLPMADHLRAVDAGDDRLLGSVGGALAGVDLKLVDEQGREPAPGGAGEVAARGPNVAAGYLKRPEATEEAFRDGWFLTGDIGRLDARGRLNLLDRKKDMIITGSEIVYSLEVEAVLHQHQGVADCAVVGVPDEIYGEALLAAVVPAPGGTLTAADLIAHCRGRIGGYKIPRRYVFLDELPRSAMNKVLKTELRRIYGAQAEAGR